ncbi:hypothetical protein V490_08094, partial [Pseudogymnoascus sp. VKM F-3557]
AGTFTPQYDATVQSQALPFNGRLGTSYVAQCSTAAQHPLRESSGPGPMTDSTLAAEDLASNRWSQPRLGHGYTEKGIACATTANSGGPKRAGRWCRRRWGWRVGTEDVTTGCDVAGCRMGLPMGLV